MDTDLDTNKMEKFNQLEGLDLSETIIQLLYLPTEIKVQIRHMITQILNRSFYKLIL